MVDKIKNQKEIKSSPLKNSNPLPEIQENPVLTKIKKLLIDCKNLLANNDRRTAVLTYDSAKSLYETNKIPDQNILKDFYEISVKLEKD